MNRDGVSSQYGSGLCVIIVVVRGREREARRGKERR